MRRRLVLFALVLLTGSPHVLAVDRDDRGDDERGALRVPGRFATIQAAVDEAQPGELIVVGPGTYCENVVISKSDIRLRAREAREGRRAVLSGACTASGAGYGYGFKVIGTITAPVTNIEIEGFVVDGFETGILLQNVVRSRVSSNEVRNNQRPGSAAPGLQNGILLWTASFNEITRNFVHDNGHMGIGVRTGSNSNIIQANRLIDNQATYAPSCSLMVYANSVGNQIVDNEVVDNVPGNGIMVGSGTTSVATQTLVAGNEVHGHAKAGIVVEPNSQLNLILRNDSTGNGLGGVEPDLLDLNATSTNLWIQNAGTCAPGNAGCP